MLTATEQRGLGLEIGGRPLPPAAYAPDGFATIYSAARWIVLIACFFLSWQLVRIPALNFTLSDGAFILALVALLLAGRLNPAFFGRLTSLWMVGVLMLIGGLFVGSIVHDQTLRWSIVASQYLIVFLFVPLVLTSFDRDFLGKATLAFTYGVATSQVLGIIALKWFGYDAVVPYVGRTVVRGNDRIGAMTAEPNANGAVCVFALVFLVLAMIDRRIHPFLGALIAAIVGAGLLFSASFTSLLALAASLGLIGILTWSNGFKSIGMPLLVIAVLYIGLGGPLPQIFVERVAEAVVGLDLSKAGTFAGRSALIAEAWTLADPHLLIGMGVDKFREASIHGAPVHNLALLLLNEGGAISLIGLTTLLLCLFSASIMVGRTDHVGGAACFAVLVVILLYTMSLPHMYARHWFGPVVLTFSFYMATKRLPFSPHPTSQDVHSPHGPGLQPGSVPK
ncbi:hypothetical protein ACI5KX_12290 [Erythrobacter sp. GH1-10]|uniref:hypothetical protein n=1 Tax=Erythrobacter sp. GH1-10 TaxID=3349334 RepID=UPI003877B68B